MRENELELKEERILLTKCWGKGKVGEEKFEVDGRKR